MPSYNPLFAFFSPSFVLTVLTFIVVYGDARKLEHQGYEVNAFRSATKTALLGVIFVFVAFIFATTVLGLSFFHLNDDFVAHPWQSIVKSLAYLIAWIVYFARRKKIISRGIRKDISQQPQQKSVWLFFKKVLVVILIGIVLPAIAGLLFLFTGFALFYKP